MLKGLFSALWFVVSAAILLAPAFFLFWLSDWHVHLDVLRHGKRTVARVVSMREFRSTMPNMSGVDAMKTYYLGLEYTDDSGREWVIDWDSSYDLFTKVQIGYSVPIRYVAGEGGGVIPDGEVFQAFTDCGKFGMAGVVGLIYLLGAGVFLAFVLRMRLRGEEF